MNEQSKDDIERLVAERTSELSAANLQLEHEIAERKIAEEQISLLSERISMATHSAQVGIWDWDVVNDLLTWDDQMYALYGQKKEEFPGAYDTWVKGLHPDDRTACEEETIQVLRDAKDYDSEFRVVWPDGSVHFLKAKGNVIRDANGTPLRVIGVNYDITLSKQAEQALSLHGEIMANMTEGVILIRVKDGVIVYANPKLEEMFCYNSGELIGKHISIVNAPSEKSPEETAQAIVSHLHENGIWRGEVNCRKKDNSHFWCYANVSTFNHKEYGEVWISVHSDISDRKTIMAELESSYQQLRVFNQRWVEIEELERKRLSAELHDEIGQNLTALGINFTIVKMSLPPGTDSIVYDRIDESMDLLKRTTAQIKGIMSNLRPTILDEYGLVPALHWYSQENAKRTGIEISFAAEELPFRPVTEIETALFRIAQEAINNSIKHAGANCISMTLDYAENRLYLAITDDGAGFEMQMVQKQDNRGWGLMIMKERCLGIKGIFNVESIPGEGTKISVEVPL